MTRDTTKEAAVAAEVLLFDDWFDAIEDGVRARVRGFIDTMLEEELSEAPVPAVSPSSPRRSRCGGGWNWVGVVRNPHPGPKNGVHFRMRDGFGLRRRVDGDARHLGFVALARVAAANVYASRSSSFSAPIHPRQTDIEVRSSGSLVWK